MSAQGSKAKEVLRVENGVYEIVKPIATGTFGAVYKVKRESDEKYFAVRCESINMKSSLLRQASMVLNALQYPSPFFTTIEQRGAVPGRFLFAITPLYGDNLYNLMVKTNKDHKFSASSSIHLGIQTLSAIRDLHRNGFIHRDVKPSHFCIGLEAENTHHHVYLIDFGLCRRPKNVEFDAEGDAEIKKNSIVYRGVVRYASVNAHKGKDLGFRDDMESWWYMLIEFFSGALPWSVLSKTKEKEVIVLKTGLKMDVLNTMIKKKEVIPILLDIITMIRATATVSDYCKYDEIYDKLESMYGKTGSNPVEPPDWDGMADYMGPKYESVILTPLKNIQKMADVEFKNAEGKGMKGAEGTGNPSDNDEEDDKKKKKKKKKKCNAKTQTVSVDETSKKKMKKK